MYSDLVRKGAPNYIKGYGYGILAEGEITGDLRGEEEAKYKRYYHTYESEDPNLILYMNDKGSVVSGLVGYVSGSHYDIVMNEERTDYKWVGDLATNDTPIAVDPAADGSSRVYRFPVKTGEALKYSTLTQVPELAAFNNRPVALEDYVTHPIQTLRKDSGFEVTDRIDTVIYADGAAEELIRAALAEYADYVAAQTLSLSLEQQPLAGAPAGAAEVEWGDGAIRILVKKHTL